MATIYFEDDGDLSVLAGKVVSVLGYGHQGSAQAQNMRDNGIRVVVGNRRDEAFDQASADGFETYEISEAVRRADCHFLLIPDEVQPSLFEQEVRPFLKPHQAIVVSSGYNVAFHLLDVPRDIDLLMIAPAMIGAGVRSTYLDGTGFPSLVSVERDASGNARAVLLALCKAIGTLKRCAIASSCEEEALCDLFNEQSGGLYTMRRLYEVLVEAGASPEAAMLTFWVSGEDAEVGKAMRSMGLFHQIVLHSRTSQYGQQVTGRLTPEEEENERRRLRKVIARIKDGTFAKDWTLEQQAGFPTLSRVYQQNISHPMAKEEERFLRTLGLLDRPDSGQ